MDCEFTEDVSLLVDGELPPREAARLGAHVEGCAACRQARESFLLLRQELRSYERAPDPHAQSIALASILNSRTSELKTAGRPTNPRGVVGRLKESLAGAFGLTGLRPAHVATLALLLIGAALGVRWFTGSRTSTRTPTPGAPAAANANSLPAQAPAAAEDGGTRPDEHHNAGSPTVLHANATKTPRHAGAAPPSRAGREHALVKRGDHRTGRRGQEGPGREVRREEAHVVEPAPLPSSAGAVALYMAGSLRATAADPSLRIERHAERVERLLRSFRNARLTEHDPTLDVADARRLSKRLLYSNIALRREAASAGDRPVEGLLDSVEPILLDISNLPQTPSPEAVGSIKERIHRRQLVGILQVQGMQASR
ncbi:MAG TPA: zf-HC2 domain-containing protein [Pyrinomonadaceae bacterium]